MAKNDKLVESDYVLTPEWCAKDIMEYFAPTGKMLDPCRGLNKVFHNQMPKDADWCEIQEGNNFFEYTDKVDWYGKNILKIGRFEPSSKLHANCGHINKDLKLSDRKWICPKCGDVVSRDVNAAINIKSFALKNILSGTDRKNQGELSTMVEVLTLEAHPIAFGVGG